VGITKANEGLTPDRGRGQIEAALEALAWARSDLDSLLDGLGIATLYLDDRGRIKSFSESVSTLFQIGPEDLGRPLEDLSHLAVEMPPLPSGIDGVASAGSCQDDIVTTDGRWFQRQVLPYRHRGESVGSIVTFLEISQQKRARMRQAAAHEVTQLLASADSLGTVLPRLLEAVRSNLDVHYCALWLPDREARHLVCAHIATLPDRTRITAFVEYSEKLRLKRGEGLPGHVWATGQPHWIVDVADDPTFVRRELAARCGLSGGAALPIVSGTISYGVIEFFADRPLISEPSWLEMLNEVGHAIGQFFRRNQLDDRIRTEQARKNAIFAAALDCIVTMDVAGRIVDFNAAAEKTFGIRAQDAIGQPLVEVMIPPEHRAQHREGLKRYLETGETSILGRRIEITAQRASGDSFPVELSVHASRGRDGQPFFTGYLRDITQRQQAEQRLAEVLAASQATEAKFRVLFDQSLYFAGILDLQGVLTDVNQTALVQCGYARDEVVGLPFWETPWWSGSEDVQQTLRTAVRRATGGAFFRAELPYWVADGTQRYTEFALTPVLDGNGEVTFIVPTGSDITDKYQLQQMLAAKARRTAMALRAGGMAAWEWTPTESIWTEGVFELLGISAEQTPSTELFFASVHPDDLPGLEEAWQLAITGMRPYDHEFRIVRPNGKIRWLKGVGEVERDAEGRVKTIYGLNWDVTQSKRAELREKRAAEIEHFLLEATTALAATLDPEATLSKVTELCVPTLADWAFIDLLESTGSTRRIAVAHADPSQAVLAAEVARFPARPQWQGHPPARGLFSGEGLVIEKFTEEMLREASQSAEHERVMRAVGPESFIVVPLMGRGEPIGALTLISVDPARRYGPDDLKIAEEFSRRASIAIDNSRLYETSREANRAKSEFLANMSHEIRTPMTAVLGYADLIAAKEMDPQKREFIEIIKRNGKHLLELINDILDLSKVESDTLEVVTQSFSPQQIIADVQATMNVRAAEKQLDLLVEYVTDVPAVVESDPGRLRQILMNLVGNAVKFTESGSVRLEIRHLKDPHEPQLQFAVIDTGIGITEEQSTRLFKPFSQGDPSVTRKFGGTGLGLVISQRLAQRLGGEITFDSTPGKGTTFRFTMPIGKLSGTPESGDVPTGPLAQTPPSKTSTSSPPKRLQGRVLVVDDRRDVRFLTQHILTAAGADVSLASDGIEALGLLQQAARNDQVWDVILLDMQMPRLDGYETAKRLRKLGFSNPMIALTADAMQGDRDRCLQCGCDDYLTKPIDVEALLQLVDLYLRRTEKTPPT
jgi:PAS domain S-box-containing protein